MLCEVSFSGDEETRCTGAEGVIAARSSEILPLKYRYNEDSIPINANFLKQSFPNWSVFNLQEVYGNGKKIGGP